VQALGPGQGQYWSYNSPQGGCSPTACCGDAGGAADRVLMLLSSDLVEPARVPSWISIVSGVAPSR
jgi:hypothetical protein